MAVEQATMEQATEAAKPEQVEPKLKPRLTLLPQAKTSSKQELADYTTLIYGPPGVGKSTLASHFDRAVFAASEAGLNALEVYQVPITDWPTFLAFCKEFGEGNHDFGTVVVDTVDNLYGFCSEHVCAKAKITHESDLEWGKGWALVSEEFTRVVTKLSHLPYGLVLISHAQDIEIKTRVGTITKSIPTMPKQARNCILPLCDFVLFCRTELTKDGERRVIKTRPSENWEAKSKLQHFPPELELNYAAFAAAFEKGVKHRG